MPELPELLLEVMASLRDLVENLKAQTTRLEQLQQRNEQQHEAIMKSLDAFRAEMRSEFAALRAEREQLLPGQVVSRRIH